MSNIRQLRHDARLSLRQLERATGIDNSNLSRLEHGKMQMFPSWRSRIATALGVTESELL
jgi:transcriptional regulator with XRE-family HTH domain